jgi:hypothetical protein
VCAQWERMSDCKDNQDVGLEAATIERVRKSSLVESSRADNPTGLCKHATEAAHAVGFRPRGRGVFRAGGEGRAGARLERAEARMPERVAAIDVTIVDTASPRVPEPW